MDDWQELRTAYEVGKRGTVSATAEALGIHRATVIRHVDALEASLGVRLFHRHNRGYTLTEAGEDMQRVARATEDQLDHLRRRIKGRAVSLTGEVVLTTVEIVAPLLMPALRHLRAAQPSARLRVEVSARLYHLEYGEAHVAVRTGRKPADPDNVVEAYGVMQSALFAHPDYLSERGVPGSVEALADHDVVADPEPDSPFFLTRWMHTHVGAERIVFGSANPRVNLLGLRWGLGVGFCPVYLGERWGLKRVLPPEPAWDVSLWLVTHVDLHRSPKVQTVLQALRDGRAEGSPTPMGGD